MTDSHDPSLADDAELLHGKDTPAKMVVTLTHEYLIHEDGDQARTFAERETAIEDHLIRGYKLASTFFVSVGIKATIVDTLTR